VGQIISRVGQLAQADVAAAQQPPLAAEAVYGYRNKIQMAFSSLVWQQQQQQGLSEERGAVQQGFGLGYFLPGSNSVVLPIHECSLAVSSAKYSGRLAVTYLYWCHCIENLCAQKVLLGQSRMVYPIVSAHTSMGVIGLTVSTVCQHRVPGAGFAFMSPAAITPC
jgi:hypothetical protein